MLASSLSTSGYYLLKLFLNCEMFYSVKFSRDECFQLPIKYAQSNQTGAPGYYLLCCSIIPGPINLFNGYCVNSLVELVQPPISNSCMCFSSRSTEVYVCCIVYKNTKTVFTNYI